MNIKYNAKKTVAIITPEEGYKLTDYKEDDDILTFNCYDRVMCPVAKAEKYTEISEATAAEYKAEKEAKLTEINAKREAGAGSTSKAGDVDSSPTIEADGAAETEVDATSAES